VKKHQHKQFRVEDESIWRRDTTFAGMESSETTQDASGDPSTPASTAATFESMRGLLQSKDDTSRFVGLALLKSVLDNGQLGQNPTQLKILWEAISPKFLDRLLRTERNEKVSQAEARNMIDLATAILHTFASLLPEESKKEKRLFARSGPLLKALIERLDSRSLLLDGILSSCSPPETTKLILQTLLTISSQPEGAIDILKIEDLSPLIEIAAEQSLALDVLSFTWTNAAVVPSEVDTVRKSINKLIPTLQTVFKTTDAVTFLSFVAGLLPKLAPEVSTLPGTLL
jgi:hypothetical protein